MHWCLETEQIRRDTEMKAYRCAQSNRGMSEQCTSTLTPIYVPKLSVVFDPYHMFLAI